MFTYIFYLTVTESLPHKADIIELQCVLNTFKGYVPCNNREILIKWSAEDDTPISGDRFTFENSSDCFSKLIIKEKQTDHHRKWKCHLTQNGEIKATIVYTTTVTGTKLPHKVTYNAFLIYPKYNQCCFL